MPTIIVYWSPGRDSTQKEQVARRITDALVEEAGAKRDDVLIIFQNIEPGDAAKGSQLPVQHDDRNTPSV
jgi:phenylpyruvate tautomerase PptA (4-oxalocrotonate tautomerase family)